MSIVTTSPKGQVLIPAALRKQIGLKPGGKVLITAAGGNRILIEPVPDDPIAGLTGILRDGPSLTAALLEERRKDREREEEKSARLLRAARVAAGRGRRAPRREPPHRGEKAR